MSDAVAGIASIRDAVCGLLRIIPGQAPGQARLGIVGTTWCVSESGVFVTAHHVLNDGKARDPSHRYYVLRARENGQALEHWPVTGFRLEDGKRDLVLLDAPAPTGLFVRAIPVALAPPPDGTPVLTYGCPAPAIHAATVSNEGNLVSIRTALFTHGNTGIIAAQYPAAPLTDTLFEFSVGWHHGESGGPILQLQPRLAAIAVMQHYRNIEGPRGTMAGPRRGIALAAIESELSGAGASFV
jgi:hypothetical protein